MNVRDAVAKGDALLAGAGVEEPRREAALLLGLATGRDRTYLFAHPDAEIDGSAARRYEAFLHRRSNREPFHYIAGVKEFFGLDFEVGPGVLIPRPETEILVEAAIAAAAWRSAPRLLEIGVGSGCISISLLKNLPTASAAATDISVDALAIARRNAELHGLSGRVELIQGDVYAGMTDKFDLIVSNPPYIPSSDEAQLGPEVRDHEPHPALFGGADGLDVVRRIVNGAPSRLVANGDVFLEIGIGQAAAVGALFAPDVWHEPGFIRDLQGIERIVRCSLR